MATYMGRQMHIWVDGYTYVQMDTYVDRWMCMLSMKKLRNISGCMHTYLIILIQTVVGGYICGQINIHVSMWRNMWVDEYPCDWRDTHVDRLIHMWVDEFTCRQMYTHVDR